MKETETFSTFKPYKTEALQLSAKNAVNAQKLADMASFKEFTIDLPQEQVNQMRVPNTAAEKNQMATDFITRDYDKMKNLFVPAEPASQLATPDNFTKNAALYAAIERRSNDKAQEAIQQLKTQASLQAPEIREKRIAGSFDTSMRGLQLESQKYIEMKKRQYEKRMRERAARAGVVSTILGVAGAVVGAVVAGPVGATAGYAVGSGIGGASQS